MKIDGTNDGPQSKFEKKEQIKLVLDMSNDGPMFKEQIPFISYLTTPDCPGFALWDNT